MSCIPIDPLTSNSLDLVSRQSLVFPWYAVRTKSNQEKIVLSVLYGKGYQPYLPLYTDRRRRVDRTIVRQRPLFPGYLFCRFDPEKRLPILTTAGVVSIVGFGPELAAIPDAEIEAIEAILTSGLAVRPCAYFQEGQRIRVVRGSLQGLEGKLVRVKNGLRLVFSVNMLQRSVAVEIDRDFIVTV